MKAHALQPPPPFSPCKKRPLLTGRFLPFFSLFITMFDLHFIRTFILFLIFFSTKWDYSINMTCSSIPPAMSLRRCPMSHLHNIWLFPADFPVGPVAHTHGWCWKVLSRHPCTGDVFATEMPEATCGAEWMNISSVTRYCQVALWGGCDHFKWCWLCGTAVSPGPHQKTLSGQGPSL